MDEVKPEAYSILVHSNVMNSTLTMCPPETDPLILEKWISVEPSVHDVQLDEPSTWYPDTTGEYPYSRILIYRDYHEWPGLKFSEGTPPALVEKMVILLAKHCSMHVEERLWNRTLEEINKICAEVEQVSWTTVLDTMAYCCFSRRKNTTEKCMDRLAAYIAKENETVFGPLGLEFKHPALNGYRYIEVVVKYLRFRTSKPILHWGVDYKTDCNSTDCSQKSSNSAYT